MLFTCLNIAYAVNKLSQYMHQSCDEHWFTAKRVLCYLSGTKKMGLFSYASNPISVHAYFDADWIGDKNNYTSMCAYLVYVGKHLVSWSSKK